jgi:hypothetical protein
MMAPGVRALLASGVAVCVVAAIESAAAGTVVSGTVVGRTTGPIVGARVLLEEPERATQTDADGRFTFVDVPAARYHLRVEADGFVTSRSELVVGTTSVVADIVLESGTP